MHGEDRQVNAVQAFGGPHEATMMRTHGFASSRLRIRLVQLSHTERRPKRFKSAPEMRLKASCAAVGVILQHASARTFHLPLLWAKTEVVLEI